MKFKVKVFATIREITKAKEIELESEDSITVSDAIKLLIQRYGDKLANYLMEKNGKPKPAFILMVNGVSINELKGLDTSLKDKDILAILPPVAGGNIHTLHLIF
ncbi:MAG: MoaD family protein [Candidatus Freyarchaeota archaeon]|nr:MoaD family protein [Candidatus Jordarchaeia archaeon]MBS7268932.1 MoaD family protein [Candidatus Jordarchaeia archaeon]MBS7279478.1 MoaD family protein [Candidatus Jordarchaeia archaeon]